MKRSKVDAVVRKYSAEARAAGERSGQDIERRRWEALLPIPGDQNVVWLDEPPKTLRRVLAIAPRDPRGPFGVLGPYDDRFDFRMARSILRLEFEGVPMALTIANGVQVRWFHWKPRGPYPVSELAVLR